MLCALCVALGYPGVDAAAGIQFIERELPSANDDEEEGMHRHAPLVLPAPAKKSVPNLHPPVRSI
jgi:hypothetical protein